MHTWLILAAVIGVGFGGIKPPGAWKDFCIIGGNKVEIGDSYQSPGKCVLEKCVKSEYGDHLGIDLVTCPVKFQYVKKGAIFTTVPPGLPYPKCCKTGYAFED